ncbi:MAG: hypothetical protein M3Z09_05845 [Acidobacteriota bacterium]|nr:hypothetical protein [Acidobacteriota bacterium]
MRKAIQNYRHDALAEEHYSYLTTDENDAKSTEVTRTAPLAGAPYERLVSRDGKPLTPEQQEREDAKYNSAKRARQNQTPAERERQRRKRRSETKFLDDVPDAFDFQLLRKEVVNGRSSYVVKASPKPGFEAHDVKGRMFSNIEATIWIDAREYRMAKAEAEVTGTIAVGWFMARIGKGGHFELTQTRVAENLWFPEEIDVSGKARILLVDRKSLDEKITFSDYRVAK